MTGAARRLRIRLPATRVFAVAWTFSALCSVALAADGPISPLQLVDSRAGVCLEAKNLEAHGKEISHSAWAALWKGSKLYTSWKSSDPARRISEARGPIETLADKPLEAFLGELFGRHVVVALHQDGAADPQGLMVTEVASEEALTEALTLWNRAEPQKTETRTHAGTNYFRRVRTAESGRMAETLYYARFGRILALSHHERLVQRAVELAMRSAGEPGASRAADVRDDVAAIDASEEFVASHRTLSESCFLRAYLQPQNWRWKKTTENEPTSESEAMPDWVRGWQHCRSVAVGLRFDEGWILEGTARFPENASSSRWLRFVEGSREHSMLARRVPDDALIAWAGSVDFTDFAKLFQELLPAKDRREFAKLRQVSRGLLLGRDLLTDVIPSLGPAHAGYLRSKKPAGEGEFPWEAVAGLKLTPNDPVDDPQRSAQATLHAGLDNALNTGLNVLAAMWNAEKADGGAIVRSEPITLKLDSPATVRWIEGIGPLSPAFSALPDRIAFGTSPMAVRQFLQGDPERPMLGAKWFQGMVSKHFRGGNQVVLVNVAALRSSLDDNRSKLVNHAVRRESISPEEAERRLQEVQDVLRLVDAAFATAELKEHEVRLTVGGVLLDVKPATR